MIRFLLIASIILSYSASSKEKIVDKSGRQPKWVNGLEKGYIITSAKGMDLEKAKNQCIIRVKEQIVNSIADNVKSKTEINTSESTLNHQVSTFLEDYSSTTTSESGKTDFVQGISITKVEDFYWEKIQDKEKGKSWFQYHIKYPFGEKEMDDLVASYKMKDAELSFQLNKELNAISEHSSLEEINASIKKLQVLRRSFIDLRNDQAKAGIAELNGMLENIEFDVISHKIGKLEYVMQYQGRSLSFGKNPEVSSECASILGVTRVENRVVIKYNADYCIVQDPDNGIDIEYKIGKTKISNRFTFDVTQDKVVLNIKGKIRIKGSSPSLISLSVLSKYDNPFIITKLDLEIQGSSLVISGIDKIFKGKGIHELTCTASKKLEIPSTGNLSGTIFYKSQKSGQMSRYRFYNTSFIRE